MKAKRIITAALSVIALISLNSCEDWGLGCIDGNDRLTTEERVISDFSGVEVNGSFDVIIDTSAETSLLIEADENLLDYIKTRVRGNMLVIDTYRDRCLRSDNRIAIYISTPYISDIILNGSGRIDCGSFEAGEAKMEVNGSGEINFDNAVTGELFLILNGSGEINGYARTGASDLEIDGSGEINIDGTCPLADMKIIGSGNIRAADFITGDCEVTIIGSGNATVFASSLLDAQITGSGNVYYYGNPDNVIKDITGSGKVIKR
ncbi:MAG: head GIN domain-containing protein [Bacteroidales bacterium]